MTPDEPINTDKPVADSQNESKPSERDTPSSIICDLPCVSAEQFAINISPFGPCFRQGVPPIQFLFRGVDDAHKELVPSILRQNCPLRQLCPRVPIANPENPSERELIECEIDILARFFERADAQGLHLPEDSRENRERLVSISKRSAFIEQIIEKELIWPDESLLSFMGLAQHHGLPTRLLDWSRNPLKAAYFPCIDIMRRVDKLESIDDVRIALWAMSRVPADINELLDPYTIGSPPDIRLRIITAPAATNQNLRAQEGVFTVIQPRNPKCEYLLDRRPLDKQLGERFTECVSLTQPVSEALTSNRVNPLFFRFTLPASECGKLMWILASWGISAASMFPGFRGAADTVREEQFWKRPNWPL